MSEFDGIKPVGQAWPIRAPRKTAQRRKPKRSRPRRGRPRGDDGSEDAGSRQHLDEFV